MNRDSRLAAAIARRNIALPGTRAALSAEHEVARLACDTWHEYEAEAIEDPTADLHVVCALGADFERALAKAHTELVEFDRAQRRRMITRRCGRSEPRRAARRTGARRRGAGRPRAAARRSSARSGDSGPGSSDPGEPAGHSADAPVAIGGAS